MATRLDSHEIEWKVETYLNLWTSCTSASKYCWAFHYL